MIIKPITFSDIVSSVTEDSGVGSVAAPGTDYGAMVSEVIKMQMATNHIMPMVRDEIKKGGWRQIPNAEAARSSKSWFYDPLTLQYSLGYKDRRFSLTYDMLKKMAAQLSIVSAIINTRSAQISAFAQPFSQSRSLGFSIKHKDSDHATTSSELEHIKDLERFIMNCGREPNPYSRAGKRDDFEDFLRKLVRDSLTYDQVCAEVVPDRLGIPYEFVAVDASTIRIASDDRYVGINSSFHERQGFVPAVPGRFQNMYEGRQYGQDEVTTASGEPVSYVQLINGQIENVYSESELVFGVRNPRTDIYIQGYGYGELEQLMTIITSHLYAEEYNRKFFSQGSAPKGLLNLKGDNWTPEMLEEFQRMWQSQVSGAENAWKTPVLQSEGLEWIDLNKTNREMEFGQWMEYLIKVTTGVYMIDPAELNFDLSGGVSQTPLFESSSEWKLKASRDRGLKPLLKFFAKIINKNIIDKIDDHFTLEFIGLDELSETDKHNMLTEQLAAYMTLNEVRRQLDLPDLPNGDVPLNPTYLDSVRLANETKQQEQQAEQEQGAMEGAVEGEPPQEGGLPGSDPMLEDEGPQYPDQFGMSNPSEAFGGEGQ
jgi:hypothetical protein